MECYEYILGPEMMIVVGTFEAFLSSMKKELKLFRSILGQLVFVKFGMSPAFFLKNVQLVVFITVRRVNVNGFQCHKV